MTEHGDFETTVLAIFAVVTLGAGIVAIVAPPPVLAFFTRFNRLNPRVGGPLFAARWAGIGLVVIAAISAAGAFGLLAT
jgi:hypothetical protein